MPGGGLTSETYLDICPGFGSSLCVSVHQETGCLGCVDRRCPGDDCHLVAEPLKQFDDLAADKASAARHQYLLGAHHFPLLLSALKRQEISLIISGLTSWAERKRNCYA